MAILSDNHFYMVIRFSGFGVSNRNGNDAMTNPTNPSPNSAINDIMLMIPVRRGDSVAEMKHAQIKTAIQNLLTTTHNNWVQEVIEKLPDYNDLPTAHNPELQHEDIYEAGYKLALRTVTSLVEGMKT